VTFNDRAIYRHLLAGPNPEPVAGHYLFERNVLVRAIVPHDPRPLRREVEEVPDCAVRGRATDAHPRWKNGQPHHSTAGDPRTS
jgi:hypothetical protein